MQSDSQLRSEFRSALEAVTPPAPWPNVSPPSLPGRLRPQTDSSYLLDATHAWVGESSVGASGGADPYVTTFRTVDGGRTWDAGASIGGQSPKLFFIDQNHGWLL